MSDDGPFGMSDMGDSVVPIYEFEWEDGSVRRTDSIDEHEDWPAAIQELVNIGHEDPDCEVTLIGFGS